MEIETGAEFISDSHVRHIMRYVSAAKYIDRDDYVLDAACGTGYGSRILAKICKKVIGIDYSADAIREANKDKPHNCEFVLDNLLMGHFGVRKKIVSLETLEHFSKEDGEKLLCNFNSCLNDNGVLIISTPYCSISGPSPITKQHLWEYSLTDFEQALNGAGFNVEQMEITRHEGQAGRLGYCLAKAVKQ